MPDKPTAGFEIIEKVHRPWQWIGVPGSYVDERPKTKASDDRTLDPSEYFYDKADKIVPEELYNISSFKLDIAFNPYYKMMGIKLGNLDDSFININDVFIGDEFDGGDYS